ncbi:hypothetical protein LguiA_010500 [Lonicera macranthoides]
MKSEPSSTPKLPLFSIPPEPPGMVVPSPLHTSASVPFRWEEEPGKPRPCTTTTTNGSQSKSLDLPPRLMMIKMPSPANVLDGPYITTAKLSSSNRFFSSSFRFSRDKWSFDGVSNKSPDHGGQFGPMGVVDKKLDHKGIGLGLLGSWGQRSLKVKGEKEENVGGSFAFSSSSVEVVGCGEVESGKVKRITRNGSLSRLSKPRSHFWATIYEGIKQVIPWKSRKSKRGGFII